MNTFWKMGYRFKRLVGDFLTGAVENWVFIIVIGLLIGLLTYSIHLNNETDKFIKESKETRSNLTSEVTKHDAEVEKEKEEWVR